MSQQHGYPPSGSKPPPPYAPAPPGFGGPPPAPGGYAPAPPYAPAPAAGPYQPPGYAQLGYQQPLYAAPGGRPRKSRTGLVVGLVAGGLGAVAAVVIAISILSDEDEAAAPTMPSLDMTEIIDVLNPVEVGGTPSITSAPGTTTTPDVSTPVSGPVAVSTIDLGGGFTFQPPGAGFEIFASEPGFVGITTPTGGEVDLVVDPSYGQADAVANIEAELRAAFAGVGADFQPVGAAEPLEIGVGTSSAALDFSATLMSGGGSLPTLGVGILVVKGDGAALLIVAQTPNADFQTFLDADVATVINGIQF